MSSAAFSLDHLSSFASEKLCYVHCSFCDTVLAVSVPCSSLFKTVTVRCGHCTNLLSVNMRALLLPAANQYHSDAFLIPTHTSLLEELSCPPTPLLPEQAAATQNQTIAPAKGTQEMNQIPAVNRRLQYLAAKGISTREEASLRAAPEKRQRVPSAYNRFIKEEIQRIKAGNPDITHREAFSAAAKNWAHFPHIHFGLMPDQGPKSIIRQQEGEDLLLKDGFYAAAAAAAAAANMGVTPF